MRLQVAGVEVGIERRGRGAPLVLLHAFPLDRRMWAPAIEELALGADLIALDFPGLGESASASSAPSIDGAADQVAAVLDALALPRAVIAGVSMGGYVALACAARHRARVAGLLLCDTRAGADGDEQRAARDAAIARVVREGARGYVRELVPRLVAPSSKSTLALALAIAELQATAGIAGALAALRDRPDRTGLLPSLTMPATVLVGAEDTVTPPTEVRRMHASLPGAVLVEIPHAGHLAPLEAPGAFALAARALLHRAAT